MELDFILSKEEKGSAGKAELIYDLAIIGGGPAGMTAAVYAARKKLKILLVSKDLGGQVLSTTEVENYMGYQYIEGRQLMNKFKEQMRHFPIDQEIGEEIEKLDKEEKVFSLKKRSIADTAVTYSPSYQSLFSWDIKGAGSLSRGDNYCLSPEFLSGSGEDGKDFLILT